jgi:hypothetical protein
MMNEIAWRRLTQKRSETGEGKLENRFSFQTPELRGTVSIAFGSAMSS